MAVDLTGRKPMAARRDDTACLLRHVRQRSERPQRSTFRVTGEDRVRRVLDVEELRARPDDTRERDTGSYEDVEVQRRWWRGGGRSSGERDERKQSSETAHTGRLTFGLVADPLRILVSAPVYWPAHAFGGPTQVMRRLVAELARRGHTIDVFTTSLVDLDGHRSWHSRTVPLDDATVHYPATPARFRWMGVQP